MKKILCLAMLLSVTIMLRAQTKADNAYSKMMWEYAEKIKKAKTQTERVRLINEMQAKQQAYAKQRMDTATQLQRNAGVEMTLNAVKEMQAKTGKDKYLNNPLFGKYKIVVSYISKGNNSIIDKVFKKSGGSTSNCTGTIEMVAYMLNSNGALIFIDDKDAIESYHCSGAITESGFEKSPSGNDEWSGTASAITDSLPHVAFSYQGPQQWSASANIFYKGTRTDKDGSSESFSDAGLEANNENGSITRDGNGYRISRNVNERQDQGSEEHPNITESTGSFTMTITPFKTSNYIAFFEPVLGQDDYEKWMPEARKAGSAKSGNYIDIRLRLESVDKPGKDMNNLIKYIKWELPTNEVSRVPGYANNAPTENVQQYKKPGKNDPISRLADMQLHLTTEKPDTSVEVLEAISTAANNYTIRVYSFDWGGYATLKARVVLADSSEVIATVKGAGSDGLPIPFREPGSRIATYFKQLNKASSLKDDDDSEKNLSDDKYPGDGFSLYEEYRGFMEGDRHIFGNPTAKDVMIYNGINTARSRDGIVMYEMVLNNYTGKVVKVHHHFTKEEFGLRQTDADVPATEKTAAKDYGTQLLYHNKCLNFNNLPVTHLVNQHGISMLETPKELGYAMAVANKNGLNGPPANYDFLFISADFSPNPEGWSRIKVDMDSLGNFTVNPNGKSEVITDEYAVTVAHEMLHNSGVNHHGDNGDYNGIKRTKMTYEGNFLWKLNGANLVNLYWEDAPAAPIDTTDKTFKKMLSDYRGALMVRTWHGTCSGMEDCIMRYDDAKAYCIDQNSDKVYIIRAPNKSGELTGTKLCTSPKGTGVNDPGHKPMSRYGDSDAGRGDCIHQFCINDKYAHD